jgi:hypothetical protein
LNELFVSHSATARAKPAEAGSTALGERYHRRCLQRNRLEYWSATNWDSVRFGWVLGDMSQRRVVTAVVDAVAAAFDSRDGG